MSVFSNRYFKTVLHLFFIFALLLAMQIPLFSSEPTTSGTEGITGLWENSSRFIIIHDGSDSDLCTTVLKVFYGWYYDVASDGSMPNATSVTLLPKYRNNTAGNNTPVISSSIETSVDGIYNLKFTYPKNTTVEVPVLQIDEELYTSFCIKKEQKEGNALLGYWAPASNIEEITLYAMSPLNEVYGWYFTNDKTYHIRYWLTDAPYEEVKATLTDGDDTFVVDKYLKIGCSTYTCVHGLKTEIRNIEIVERPSVVMNEQKTAIALGTPYLIRSSEKTSDSLYKELSEMITEQNSKKKPARKPDIEYLDLDFHHEEIEAFQSDLIQSN